MMFSHFFNSKCGCALIASSFLCFFMLTGLSSVSACENGHEKEMYKRESVIDQRFACCRSDPLYRIDFLPPIIIQDAGNQTNDALG